MEDLKVVRGTSFFWFGGALVDARNVVAIRTGVDTLRSELWARLHLTNTEHVKSFVKLSHVSHEAVDRAEATQRNKELSERAVTWATEVAMVVADIQAFAEIRKG